MSGSKSELKRMCVMEPIKTAERLYELEQQISADKALIAMQAEALNKLACLGNGDKHGNSVGNSIAIEALSASAETVAAWEEAKLKPLQEAIAHYKNDQFIARFNEQKLQQQVAMLVGRIIEFVKFQKHVACGTSKIGPVSSETHAVLMDVAFNLNKLVEDTQAAAEAHDKEVAAKARLGLIVWLCECGYLTKDAMELYEADELRTKRAELGEKIK